MTAPSTVSAAVDLEEVGRLAQGGSPALALELLEANQPASPEDPGAWRRWERERLRLYRRKGDWQAVVDRVAGYTGDLPREFLHHVSTEAVRAELALERESDARRRLRRLLWRRSPQPADPAALWRRLVIRSYLGEGRNADAYIAMVRYELDYGAEDGDWNSLKARVLLQAGRLREAVELLTVPASQEDRVLALQARARLGTVPWDAALAEAESLVNDAELSVAGRRQVWAAVADAAATPAQRLLAEERGLALAGGATEVGDPGPGDALWAAYEARARELANSHQLLVGRFQDWFELAAREGAEDPAAGRAVHAYLSHHAGDPADRGRAVRLLVDGLVEAGLAPVLPHLFLVSGRYTDPEAIPPAARHALVDQVLAEGDVVLASRLLSGLTEVPAGGDAFDWRLRRARVLVLGGRAGEGVRQLQALLSDLEGLDPERIDRANQVLFELQSIGEGEAALALFGRLLELADSERVRRELLYWSADVLRELGRPREAALYYLRSALLPGPHAMDPWARSARFQAAEALAEAGLPGDAGQLYRGLLEATEDPARRAVLRRAIQNLALATAQEGP